MVIASGTCVISFVKGARLASIVGLLVSSAVFAPVMMLRSALHPVSSDIIQRFEWKTASAKVDLSVWQPGGAVRSILGSFADVQRQSRAAYSANADGALRMFSSDSVLRRAAFFTEIASHWWAPGNLTERQRIGCARQNERTSHFAVAERDVTFALYRDSEIGCCDDYSHMLKLMLDGDHIPNRLVISGGHAFNEVTIGSRRYLLDAMNAMVVSASWNAVNHGLPKGTVWWFPLGAADPASKLYRPSATVERIRLVMGMLQGGFETRYVDSLPAFFSDVPARPITSSTLLGAQEIPPTSA